MTIPRRSALVLAGLLLPLQAWAHATPTQYLPAAESVQSAAPAEISIRFTERIEPEVSTITVFDPNGQRTQSQATVSKEDRRTLRMPLVATGTGTYTVSWNVVSADDGHFTRGAFSFAVGKASSGALALGTNYQVVHSSPAPEAVTIWLELLGQACIAGVLLLWWLCRKRFPQVDARFRTIMWIGAGLIVCGTAGYLYLKADELRLAQETSFNLALQQFASTAAGWSALLRLIVGIVIAFVAQFLSQPGKKYYEWCALVLLLLVSAYVRSSISHAAASTVAPQFSIVVNFIHLLAKEAWVGMLVVTSACMLVELQRRNDAILAAHFLTSLSRYIAVAFGIGAVTGCYIVALHLKNFSNVGITHWGMQFIILCILAGFLLFMRWYNAFVEERIVVSWSRGERSSESSLGITLGLETLLGVVVLYLSATLVITTPPMRNESVFSQTLPTREGTITLERDAWDELRMRVFATTPIRTITGSTLSLTLTNADANVGPIVQPATAIFPGGFSFPVSAFTVPGTWTIQATVVQPGHFDATGTWTLKAPDDLMAVHETVNSVTLVSLVLAVCFVFVAGLFVRKSRRFEQLIGHHASDGRLVLVDYNFWIIAPLALILMQFGGVFSHSHKTATAFAARCSQNGHVWIESVPIRDGHPTSSYARLGCTLGTGTSLQHFVDLREYEAYVAPLKLEVFLEHPQPLLVGKTSHLLLSVHDDEGAHMNLETTHERIAHIIAIDDRFRFFAHTHPEDAAGYDGSRIGHELPIDIAFPHAGKYLVGADVTVKAQNVQQQYTMIVPGPTAEGEKAVYGTTAQAGDISVVFHGADSLRAGSPALVSFSFSSSSGSVADLQPYLGAAMHIAVVRDDMMTFMHVHGEVPPTWIQWLAGQRSGQGHLHSALPSHFGPTLDAQMAFPSPGTYYVFAQFKRNERVYLAPFTVTVR